MKQCIRCREHFHSAEVACLACGYEPILLDGFPCFSPELAYENAGFKANYFTELAQQEEANFWFQTRNQLIRWILAKFHPRLESFLEVGCGTGFVLSGIARHFPKARLVGSEIFVDGLSFAEKRIPNATLIQMDARNIPYKDEFDVIGAFDVLEHIEEDLLVLSQMHNALKPEGYLILTVPQHRWLWSATDEYACHVRRYTKQELHQKLEGSGFEIIRSTSFVSFLLPLMLISRLRQKKSNEEIVNELQMPKLLNSILYIVMCIEIAIIKCGINFTLGGSRLVIAKKREP